MNIGYIIDLNGIMSREDLGIPSLTGLHFRHLDTKDLTAAKVLEIRSDVMSNVREEVEKHMFIFVMKNDKKTLKALSSCLRGIQSDEQHFGQQNNEAHVVCDFTEEEAGFSIKEYEEEMTTCLTNNRICAYSWFMDKFDFSGDRPLLPKRCSHAIARLAWMLCQHNDVLRQALAPMTANLETRQPIYNLFGDACLFFDEGKRDDAVRKYYSFKSLQHLLNIADKPLDDYLRDNVLPYRDNQEELDKRIEATADQFMESQRRPVEASLIAEHTQGLLVKQSDNDTEFLLNKTSDRLAFIDELGQSGWQMVGMDKFLSDHQSNVGLLDKQQDIVSDDFVEELYEKVITHESSTFNAINNKISTSRSVHIERFKTNVDRHLNYFLNLNDRKSYGYLQESLPERETKNHFCNVDCGIAFMDYLVSGTGGSLVDQTVAVGQTNLLSIKELADQEERMRRKEYEESKSQIERKYQPQQEGELSEIRKQFESLDQGIKKCKEEKLKCDFQIDHWIDEDAEKKLTARSRAVIAVASGIVAASLWIFISIKYIAEKAKELFENYGSFQWDVFWAFILAGLVVGGVYIYKALRNRKEAEQALAEACQRKKQFMKKCVDEMMACVEKLYKHRLAYHGLKTVEELIDFAQWKKDDLVQFRKALFRLMLKYDMPLSESKRSGDNDDNTIELMDADAKLLLFGPEGHKNEIPYCFAQNDIELSNTFEDFKHRRARFETSRNGLSHTSDENLVDFDKVALEREVIPCMSEHESKGLVYTQLQESSVLPTKEGVEMDDVHQGACGDCYFMATLAAIAKMNPGFFVGEHGMVKELDSEHRFFRVRFYNNDGEPVSVDVDNRFWNSGNQPYYAKKGNPKGMEEGTYDPWVMVVEKAWAKANDNGYDGIEGASPDGKERVRRVEYSFAVTGKSAFYCMTKNVKNREKLRNMIQDHFNSGLPITLYSASEGDADFHPDSNLVHSHAYALKSVNDDGTFDIFNPWNSHSANENVRGSHFEHKDIDFIKDNFDVVVFFDIKEADFDWYEHELTDGANGDEVFEDIRRILERSFEGLNLRMASFNDLMEEQDMRTTLSNSNYLFSRNRLTGVIAGQGQHIILLEGCRQGVCDDANQRMDGYMRINLPPNTTITLVNREDDRQNMTVFRLSPHYVLESFR